MGYISFFGPIIVSIFFFLLSFMNISAAHYGWVIVPITFLASILLSILTIVYHWKGHVFAWISIVVYGLALILALLIYKGFFGPIVKVT